MVLLFLSIAIMSRKSKQSKVTNLSLYRHLHRRRKKFFFINKLVRPHVGLENSISRIGDPDLTENEGEDEGDERPQSLVNRPHLPGFETVRFVNVDQGHGERDEDRSGKERESQNRPGGES